MPTPEPPTPELPPLTLALETSCDETSVALLRGENEIVAQLVASQVEAHQLFGGVVPEIASRKHLETLHPLLDMLRREAGFDWPDLHLIAVTHAPGLVGALLVGVAAAKAISLAWRIPCVPVNHLAGHLASVRLADPQLQYPLLCLLVSGGHTELVLLTAPGAIRLLGRTRDDAVGEAYDKVARKLGLPLPGGPALEKAALQGDPRAFRFTASNLEPSLDFSYSGLKTAAAQAHDRHPDKVADIAVAFQASAITQLCRNVHRALVELAQGEQPVKTLGLCGGVAANGALRTALGQAAAEAGVSFVVPPFALCTDNAAMIAAAGVEKYRAAGSPPWSLEQLNFETHSLMPLGS